jgi:hypothetical protein
LKPELPYTPGIDGAGIVEEVGNEVKNFKVEQNIKIEGYVEDFVTSKLSLDMRSQINASRPANCCILGFIMVTDKQVHRQLMPIDNSQQVSYSIFQQKFSYVSF